MKSNKAFTLIEILIAITLTTVVLTTVTGLVLSTLVSNQRNAHLVQATYLAQESLEQMRYIRDSNWLQNYSWNGGLALWGGDFEASDFSGSTLALNLAGCPPCFSVDTEETVQLGSAFDGDGFEFQRSFTLLPLTDEDDSTQTREDSMEVMATVTWEEHGFERSVSVSTYLTNWQ